MELEFTGYQILYAVFQVHSIFRVNWKCHWSDVMPFDQTFVDELLTCSLEQIRQWTGKNLFQALSKNSVFFWWICSNYDGNGSSRYGSRLHLVSADFASLAPVQVETRFIVRPHLLLS